MMTQEIRQQVYVEDFPEGWTVYREQRGAKYVLVAENKLYPIVEVDVWPDTDLALHELLKRVHEVERPEINHAQWRNVGRARGWL